MRNLIRTFVIATLALVASRAYATPATCTITELDVAGTFPFFNVGGVGLVLPVDIGTDGTFMLQRDAYTAVYPSPGLRFDTGFGPSGWLDWDSGPIVGTIDSNGQVVLPNFGMRLWTDFSETGVPEQVGDVKASLQSGIQQRSVAGNPVLFFGEPVQPDGTVRLVGTGLVTFQLALQTGTGLTCRLSPVPDLSTLPKGPKLQAAKGKIKVGPDPAAADDEVTLTAIVAIGAPPAPVLDGSQDVLLRLQGATGQAMSVLAPGGKFSVKGKKLTLTDTDGTVIQGMRDQPHSADPDEQPPPLPPTKGGSVVIKESKKRVTLIFKLNGVDAAQLSGAGQATVAIGTLTATRAATFVPGKKATKVH
jgi:hypothetical protein